MNRTARIFLGAAVAALMHHNALAGSESLDTEANVLNRFGPPEIVHSTTDQRTDPAYLVKAFVYWPEGLRFVFLPRTLTPTEGEPVHWELKAILDERTQKGVTLEQAQKRLRSRLASQRSGQALLNQDTVDQNGH